MCHLLLHSSPNLHVVLEDAGAYCTVHFRAEFAAFCFMTLEAGWILNSYACEHFEMAFPLGIVTSHHVACTSAKSTKTCLKMSALTTIIEESYCQPECDIQAGSMISI